MGGKRKIDPDLLLAMLREGKSQRETASYFGVSPAAICKRLKRLSSPSPESVLARYDLTPQQEAFVVEKAKGKTSTQAAFESFEVSNRNSAKVIGSQLMSKPEVNMEARNKALEHLHAIREALEGRGISLPTLPDEDD